MDSSHRIPSVPPRLNLWDATSLAVGIIIGVGIFQTPASIFTQAPSVWSALLAWLVGGLLALVGALCFAELASTYPRSGGEYVYLSRAFGPMTGFLYAWVQLALIRPASIGALAYVFSLYAAELMGLGDEHRMVLLSLSLLAIAGLTTVNYLGVALGKNVQNLLTVLKIAGLAGILIIGLGWGKIENLSGGHPAPRNWFAGAMVLVLWTYAGWHEAAYIAAEVKHTRRNLPIALILGTVIVTVLYLLANLAFVLGLGMEGAQSDVAAVDLISLVWPSGGKRVMSILIVISALGALNGMIFTTARICMAFGTDHGLFASLARWSPTWHTPARALVVEALISMALVIGVFGVGPALNRVPQGAQAPNPFDDLIYVTAAVFWFLFLLTGIALFMLRHRDADLPRPFSVPGYPVLPLLFCACCVYMVYGSVMFRPHHSLVGLGITLLGLPLYHLPRRLVRAAEPAEPVGRM